MRVFYPFLFAFLVGCASLPQAPVAATAPDGLHVSLVLARDAIRGRGPLGVGDRFLLEGKVVAYATYTWADPAFVWGNQKIEYRWYSGDKLVLKHEAIFAFAKPPYYAWSQIYPTALGPGPARVELHWNGRKLAERWFEVFDQTAVPEPPRPST
jgi:hypothetical protein